MAKESLPTTTFRIYVGHLDSSVTEQMLRDKFSTYGQIVEYIRSSQSFSFICYDNLHSASIASENENGKEIGEKIMLVKLEKKAPKVIDLSSDDLLKISNCQAVILSDE
jgi:RNA recognition motif-containing protein